MPQPQMLPPHQKSAPPALMHHQQSADHHPLQLLVKELDALQKGFVKASATGLLEQLRILALPQAERPLPAKLL